MASFVLTNAWVRINAVDLSDHVREVAVDTSQEDVETTTMGATGKTRTPGLRDDKFVLTLASDFASSKVDQTLWPLFNGGSSFLVEVAAAGTAISATNPKYHGTVILTEWSPVGGKIGDFAEVPVTLPVSGTISRATA